MISPIHQPKTFSLDRFEGPLDFLFHLIQKREIDVCDVSLQSLTAQFLNYLNEHTDHLDEGAEFIGRTANLLWLKSRVLLPRQEQEEQPFEDDYEDPRFEVIHHLLEYCRFKDAAKQLSLREEQETGVFTRGANALETPPLPLGIEHISLEELSALFEHTLAKAASREGSIDEEEWRVSDKIREIKNSLKYSSPLLFTEIFSSTKSRQELIVLFLAILELMKNNDVMVVKNPDTSMIEIAAWSETSRKKA